MSRRRVVFETGRTPLNLHNGTRLSFAHGINARTNPMDIRVVVLQLVVGRTGSAAANPRFTRAAICASVPPFLF
jgi:hypothetical protein